MTMASLAGYQNRKYDLLLGNQKIWEGYLRLTIMTQMAEALLGRAEQGQIYRNLHRG